MRTISLEHYDRKYNKYVEMMLTRVKLLGYLLPIPILIVYLNDVECNTRSKLFNTDLTKDPRQSTFKQNYLKVEVNSRNETFDNITYCFRWQLNNWLPQCLFREKNIVSKFHN